MAQFFAGSRAMTLRQAFRPLHPDFDTFLFAAVGDEVDEIPLTMVSVLTRLGLDPWEEAGRIFSLSHREAIDQLARLITELPGASWTFGEAREISGSLVSLLPKYNTGPVLILQVQIKPRFCRPAVPQPPIFRLICFVFAAAALANMVAHDGFFVWYCGVLTGKIEESSAKPNYGV